MQVKPQKHLKATEVHWSFDDGQMDGDFRFFWKHRVGHTGITVGHGSFPPQKKKKKHYQLKMK